MNCVNHADRPVAAFCQNCGKPLCSECVRSVAGQVYDEACLAARLGGAPAGAGAGSGTWTTIESTVAQAAEPLNRAYGWSLQQSASPVLAGLLGFIPGVAAMYNGQFIKALAHVVIFIFLIGLTQHFPLAGLLIAAWVFYQIFDGIQTAVARRDGLPLPDPFGLNDLGQRLGMPPARGAQPPPAAWEEQLRQAAAAKAAADAGIPFPAPAPGSAGAAPGWEDQLHQAASARAAADAGIPFAAPGGAAWAPVPAPAAPPVSARGPEPVGAIVLIAVGTLFLLSSLDVFHADWVSRGWPVIVILLGLILLVRRLRAMPPAGGAL